MKIIPKFDKGDKVTFVFGDRTETGTVEVVDIFRIPKDLFVIAYDILVENGAEKTLYKHVKEKDVDKAE